MEHPPPHTTTTPSQNVTITSARKVNGMHKDPRCWEERNYGLACTLHFFHVLDAINLGKNLRKPLDLALAWSGERQSQSVVFIFLEWVKLYAPEQP